MPLLFGPSIVDSLQTPPTEPTEGIDVSAWRGGLLTVSQSIQLTSYTLKHYGVIDDNNADGSSQYPAATEWPEMSDLTKTRGNTTHIYIPFEGVNRYAPRMIAWQPSAGSPSVSLRLRAIDSLPDKTLRFAAQLQGLTVEEVFRLLALIEDDNTPKLLEPLTTIDAEVADNIDINLAFSDILGVALDERSSFEVELFNGAMEPYTAAQFTAEVQAPAFNLTTAPNPHVLGRTPSGDGTAVLRIHDVLGASGATVRVRIHIWEHIGGDIIPEITFD